ncbi:MAG: DoxX family protein [Wolinella sp.]
MNSLENLLTRIHSHDVSALVLRLVIGLAMLPHGVHKIKHGIASVMAMLGGVGLPEILAYGVYLSEVVAPILLVLGIYTRLNALIIAMTTIFIIYVAHGVDVFALTKYGGLSIELPLLFLAGSLALVFSGGGRWSVVNRS